MFKKQSPFQSAKNNMGLVMVFTLVNLALTFLNTSLSFPFSLFSPWLLGLWTSFSISESYMAEAIIYASLGIMIFMIFLGSYLGMKKKPKLMIVGLVLYFFDTMIMTYIFMSINMVEMVINLVFHIWVIYSMGAAVLILYRKPPMDQPQEVDQSYRL